MRVSGIDTSQLQKNQKNEEAKRGTYTTIQAASRAKFIDEESKDNEYLDILQKPYLYS